MRDTKLILVEGLPGLGKTTTAQWLAARLRSAQLAVNLYLETQPEHPTNVGGPLHPAGDVTGEAFFQRYTPASFVEESLQKWQAFVHAALQAEAISVFDGYPFQNSVRVLLQMDASAGCMQDYAGQVETLVMPLRPVLVYLSHRDTAHTLQHFSEISAQRGPQWKDYAITVLTRCPYATARHLEGFGGALALISDYKQLTDVLLRQSRLPRLVLEDPVGRWAGCYQQIEAFLR